MEAVVEDGDVAEHVGEEPKVWLVEAFHRLELTLLQAVEEGEEEKGRAILRTFISPFKRQTATPKMLWPTCRERYTAT